MENSSAKVIELPERTVTLIPEPGIQQDITGANSSLELANEFVVDSNEMYEIAAAERKSANTRCKNIHDKRMKLTRPLDKLKAEWTNIFQPAIETLKAVVFCYDRKMIAYADEQERIHLAAQADADEKARKDREALEKRAVKAEAKGKTEKADALRTEAEYVPQPIVNYRKATSSDVSPRKTWGAVVPTVSDKLELIRAIAGGTVPHQAVDINFTFLNQQARSMKNELNYPGVTVKETKGNASRR